MSDPIEHSDYLEKVECITKRSEIVLRRFLSIWEEWPSLLPDFFDRWDTYDETLQEEYCINFDWVGSTLNARLADVEESVRLEVMPRILAADEKLRPLADRIKEFTGFDLEESIKYRNELLELRSAMIATNK